MKTKHVVKYVRYCACASLALALAGCNMQTGDMEGSDEKDAGNSERQGLSVPVYSLKVFDADSSGRATGAAIYDSNVAGTSLRFKADKKYVFSMVSQQLNAKYQLSFTNLKDVFGSSTAPIELKNGANVVSVPPKGEYALTVNAANGSVSSSKSFQASISCSDSESGGALTVASANIGVASAGQPNMYNYSVSGIAGGQGPYWCAWDLNGTGVRNTSFDLCSNGKSKAYVNLVGNRKIGVIVKDACDTTVRLEKEVEVSTAPYSSLVGGGTIPFINGVTSNAAGNVVNHPSIDKVNYWATNQGNNEVIQSTFRNNGSASSFTIKASHTYGQPSSVKYGISIELTGITSTFNQSTGAGNVNMANAVMSKLTFITDQAGDSLPSQTLTSTNCTLSNQDAIIRQVNGVPCTKNGTTVILPRFELEVFGSYSCTGLKNASGGSVRIEGTFDGIAMLVDACIGGGGGGGGGIVPVQY